MSYIQLTNLHELNDIQNINNLAPNTPLAHREHRDRGMHELVEELAQGLIDSFPNKITVSVNQDDITVNFFNKAINNPYRIHPDPLHAQNESGKSFLRLLPRCGICSMGKSLETFQGIIEKRGNRYVGLSQ